MRGASRLDASTGWSDLSLTLRLFRSLAPLARWPLSVNLQTTNQYAMHTVAGCSPANDASQLTGTIGETNCNATNGAGCTVVDPSTASYGTGFNEAGGGAWVTELAEEGVSIWFIPRASMPAAINANASSIDTSSLGTPTAYWPSSGCAPIANFINQQQAIIDITLVLSPLPAACLPCTSRPR